MKNIIRISFLLAALLALLPSCKEDEIRGYDGPAAINLNIERYQENITFLNFGPEVESHTFDVVAQLVGYASGSDRVVEVAMAQAYYNDVATDLPASIYSIPASVTLPAGENQVVVPVTVFRDQIDDSGNYSMDLTLVSNRDFTTSYSSTLTVSFTKVFPSDWYVSNGDFWAGYNMGTCTKARYEYAYGYFGTIDLAPWSGMLGITPHITEMNRRIIEYNSQFGDDETQWLKDTDGTNLYMGRSSPF